MQIKHLRNKAGGTITEITAIGHDTYKPQGSRKNVATWFFIGTTVFDDSSGKHTGEISPIHICFDHDNPEAKAEGDAVFLKLSEYLYANGEWNDMDWKPKEKKGSKPI